ELSSQQEYMKLKARYEALQRSQRNLMGEDLGPLSSKELESLERQLVVEANQIHKDPIHAGSAIETSTCKVLCDPFCLH
ncbi:hypothetical protein HN51_028550, partial [Arachis hypogaea]